MADLTTDLLKAIATEVVANYKTNNIALTDGIVAKATELELNPEQIKRAVEVTNQIAHLSVLSDSTDKTTEFAVASYDDVIEKLLAGLSLNEGEEGATLEKSASVNVIPQNPIASVMSVFNRPSSLIQEDLEKKASEGQSQLTEAQRHDLEIQLQKELMSGMQKLASMKVESEVIQYDLVKAANVIRTEIQRKAGSDEEFCKMASQVVGNVVSTDYNALCQLALGHVKAANMTEFREYRDDKLIKVKSLHDLYKKASAHNKACLDLEDKLNKADDYLRTNVWGQGQGQGQGHEKSASFGTFAKGLMSAGKVLKSKMPSVSNSVGSIGKKTLKVGTAAMTGAEVADIAHRATPRQDVWKSLHG